MHLPTKNTNCRITTNLIENKTKPSKIPKIGWNRYMGSTLNRGPICSVSHTKTFTGTKYIWVKFQFHSIRNLEKFHKWWVNEMGNWIHHKQYGRGLNNKSLIKPMKTMIGSKLGKTWCLNYTWVRFENIKYWSSLVTWNNGKYRCTYVRTYLCFWRNSRIENVHCYSHSFEDVRH